MPRLPEPRTPALRELARQLRFQPAEASGRQLGRAEELALQLLRENEPEREWPVEWVVFRITGFRSDAPAPELTGTVRGGDLRKDLASLIQILSAAVGESETALRAKPKPTWLTVDELRARWNVSRQTLDRYRELGLFGRRVQVPRTKGRTAPQRTLYDARVVAQFEQTHRSILKGAAQFSRTDADLAQRVYHRAVRYHRTLGWSLTRISDHLSPRVHRSPGAVRRAILRMDAQQTAPLFGERASLRSSRRAEVVGAFRRGEPAQELARTASRSRASVYRMAASERARRLRGLSLVGPARPDFADDAAVAKLLASSHVTSGLGRPLPHTIAELISEADATEPVAAREKALASAYAALRFQAATAIVSLPRSPSILGGKKPRTGIDWIETQLRWAARLKAELVRSQLGLVLRTVESQLGRPLAAFPGAVAVELVAALMAGVFEAADRYDSFKGGRLAAPAGIALNRIAARWAEEHPEPAAINVPRAIARGAVSHARLDHIWRTITPWTSWLEPSPEAREKIDSIKGRGREVLIARLGWDARPPRTISQVAAELRMAPQAVTRAERAAMRQLL